MNFLNKIRDFVEGNYLYFNKAHNAPHINEQAFWRAWHCQDCLNAKKCRHCGCTTPNMFFSPNKTDSMNKWGKMLNEQQWETYKQNNTEYRAFEILQKQKVKELNASTELYREQQKLLGYTPPLSDPAYEFDRRVRQEGIIESNVGDSPDISPSLSILQSTISREEVDSDEGLPGIGGSSFEIIVNNSDFPGSNDVSGTETSDVVEEKD
jgi:hypothetical protein